jgi:LemA protein
MMKKFLPVFITLGVIAFIAFIIFSTWMGINNTMVAKEVTVDQAWAQVQNQYQRRLDLIPNLVEIVKGYAAHEKDTLTGVIEMRSKASQMTITKEVLNDPEAFKKFQKVQGDLSSFLSRLMVLTENYPNLKANENFLALQSQLEGTENRISVERKRFNDVVADYNIYIRQFPNSLFAGNKFVVKQMFQAEESAAKAPKINFDSKKDQRAP